MALETRFRRLFWIDNRTRSAARFDMQTPWAVARFAAPVRNLLSSFAAFFTALSAALTHDDLFRLESRVSSCSEVANDLFVAGRAFF